MIDLPPKFLQLQNELQGEEFPGFHAVYEDPSVDGLRTNTLKIAPQALQALLDMPLKSVPWCPDGFLLSQEAKTGKHPYHAAGLYYLQEPSTMAVAEALDPQPGECILDLSAAPGGKATHLASLMQNRGFLLANEIHAQRAWELVENLERWGARRAAISNETPERLAEFFGAFFDRVLVDAPCSGEGMFRKSESARRDWSPEFVRGCSLRQGEILRQAQRLVRPGGVLLYSTCTFNPLENETVVSRFLDEFPEFSIEVVPSRPGFQPGRPDWIEDPDISAGARQQLSRAVRIWPHTAPGEGHFLVILRKNEEPAPTITTRSRKGSPPLLPAAARKTFEAFCRDCLDAGNALPDSQELRLVDSYLYHMPQEAQFEEKSRHLRLLRPGWWLGTFKGSKRSANAYALFEPSHALAMSFQKHEALRFVDYAAQSGEIQDYMHGEVLDSPGEDGWTLLCVDGFPLGWARRKTGVLKNYYPHSLRWV